MSNKKLGWYGRIEPSGPAILNPKCSTKLDIIHDGDQVAVWNMGSYDLATVRQDKEGKYSAENDKCIYMLEYDPQRRCWGCPVILDRRAIALIQF